MNRDNMSGLFRNRLFRLRMSITANNVIVQNMAVEAWPILPFLAAKNAIETGFHRVHKKNMILQWRRKNIRKNMPGPSRSIYSELERRNKEMNILRLRREMGDSFYVPLFEVVESNIVSVRNHINEMS